MADDNDSKTTLGLSADAVQETSDINSDPNNRSDAVLQKADSGKFEEEEEGGEDKNVLYDVVQLEREEKVDMAGAATTCFNDGVSVAEEMKKAGAAASRFTDIVLEEKVGEQGFQEEGEETVEKAGGPVAYVSGVVFRNQESASASESRDKNDGVLGGQESTSDDVEFTRQGKNDGVYTKREMGVNDTNVNTDDVKCSLKIEVIDETALVGTPEFGNGFQKDRKTFIFSGNSKKNVNNNRNVWHENGGNKEKRPRRKGKSEKTKISGADEKENNLEKVEISGCDNEKGEKRVYSRKELEALRSVGLEGQRKKWTEVYCGLGPAVQQEYDGLVDSDNHRQNYQPQKKHIRVNSDPRFRNQAPRSVFGEEPSENADNDQNGCLIEQEECIEDDSDEDYGSIQKPAFSVTGEPDFDSGPPEDGLEYLRRVRWEASQIPKVKVAKVDKIKLNKEQTIYMPQIPDVAKCPVHLMPLKEWEDAFLADFSELRLALSQCEISTAKVQSSSSVHEAESFSIESILLENFDNMTVVDSCQSMHCYISEACGNPHSSTVANDGSDSIESPSSKLCASGVSWKLPTMSLILQMDSVARVSMLRKRISMAESMSNLSWDDCLWLFALSAAVDCPLDADTCAAFRSLLRKCASLRAEKLELDEEVAMLNILATISGRYFGQLEN